MQKIILTLIGLLLVAALYFISTKKKSYVNLEHETNMTSIKVTKSSTKVIEPVIEKKVKEKKEILVKETAIKSEVHKVLVPKLENNSLDPMVAQVTHVTKEKEKEKVIIKEEKIDLKSLQPLILETMKKIPECLENAYSKEDAFKCSAALRELNEKASVARGMKPMPEMKEYPKGFVWNEETKINMIKGLENSIEPMEKTQYCMENTKTPDDFAKCVGMRPDKNKPKLEDLQIKGRENNRTNNNKI